jgi:polyphosphate kinase
MKKSGQPKNIFFDRDLSWLSFNARVLAEAQRKTVPLMETPEISVHLLLNMG